MEFFSRWNMFRNAARTGKLHESGRSDTRPVQPAPASAADLHEVDAHDLDGLKRWFERPRASVLPRERVMEWYFTFHPRTAFLKNLPAYAEVADIGAGDGSLSVFRKWPGPERGDLKLYAYSIEKGRLFDDFDGFEIGDWNAAPPDFDGRCFDAIVCAHFIEHIDDPASLVEWAARKLKARGRIYLEWPSPGSLAMPSRTELANAGVSLIISRFEDDHTHQALPDTEVITAAMTANGLMVESCGIVRLPWLEDEMLAHFKDDEDGFARQAAFWSHTGWSQYIVAQKQ